MNMKPGSSRTPHDSDLIFVDPATMAVVIYSRKLKCVKKLQHKKLPMTDILNQTTADILRKASCLVVNVFIHQTISLLESI